ncbi:hypothetical protein EJB05_31296, partial [Eragrostis curvula]
MRPQSSLQNSFLEKSILYALTSPMSWRVQPRKKRQTRKSSPDDSWRYGMVTFCGKWLTKLGMGASKITIFESAEGKREAIRQLCFSLEHYRHGYQQLRQLLQDYKRPMPFHFMFIQTAVSIEA